MEYGVFWVLFQFVIYSAGVAAWSGNKTMIKVDEIEQIIRQQAKDCYPPKTDRKQFLALIIVALSTGRIANKPETRCFLFCVMKNYNLINLPEGKVNSTILNTTIAHMTHPGIKDIIMNNMVTCLEASDSSDPCINGLKYARCFAKQGLFVYVRLEESNFPTSKMPKNSTRDKLTRDKTGKSSKKRFSFGKAKRGTTLATLRVKVTTVATATNTTTAAMVASTVAQAG